MRYIMEVIRIYGKTNGRANSFVLKLHLLHPYNLICIITVSESTLILGAGFKCIGDIADALAKGMELANIRNCGAKSRREIMEKMFLFQYYSLAEKQREAYLREVVELNRK